MNPQVIRSILAKDAAAGIRAQTKDVAQKRKTKMGKGKDRKTLPDSSTGALRNISKGVSLMKSPMSKAKVMKNASKKMKKRHRVLTVSADDLVDRNTSQHLKGSQFRYLNELLYTRSSEEAAAMFSEDPKAFDAYHEGFESQRALWPEDPLQRIVDFARTLPKGSVVADFGCGDARLAAELPNLTVHSFDFVAVNKRVTACDMRNTPLKKKTADLAVFSLALMGTNCNEFIQEANRVLRKKGTMKIVEITSRIQRLTRLVNQIEKMGFVCSEKVPGDYFTYLTFIKKTECLEGQLPLIVLNPCLYKKR